MCQKKKKKFEIELYDEIQVGENIDNIQLQKVIMDRPIIIEAADKKELEEHAERFKLCKQRMKIVRMIDDGNEEDTTENLNQRQASLQNNNTSIIDFPVQNKIESKQIYQAKQQSNPRYYTISGIEIKECDGKIYQKQWMRLTDAEAQNFRLVNDSNNKIVSTNGKHIEMKKWVVVETKDVDQSAIEMEGDANEQI